MDWLRQPALVGVDCWHETRNLASASAAIVRRTSGAWLLVEFYGIAASVF